MGLLGGVGDAIGGALDSAADAVGIPEGIQDTVGAVGNAVTGDFVDAGQQALDAAGSISGGGGSGSPPSDSTGVSFGAEGPLGGGFDFSASSVDDEPSQNGTMNGTMNGSMNGAIGGGFQGAIMMEMLEDAISTQDGRAVLEAMTSGALQNGVIQRPKQVSTPRGTRNVSPPGYRTVYLGGDDDSDAYAVFKPLAQSLGLIGRESRKTFREKLDDTTREFLKHKSQFEDLAKKLGLKTSNRASGPSR